MRVLCTDRGEEFTSASFGKYCDEIGIQRHLMAPYFPQQNGVVERQNQTIVGTVVGTARSLLVTAVYLLNRSPTRSLDGKTPYEAWYNKKPAVHHFRVFGCIAYMKVTRPHLAKLDPRGLKVVFSYDPVGGQAHVSRDVVFDESTFWQWNDVIETDRNPNQFTVEYLVTSRKKEEPSIRSRHRRQQVHPLNKWNSQHHGLRIRRWMPITILIWRPGTEGWTT